MTARECVASASLYAGRPDPEWPVDAARVEALKRIWGALPPGKNPPPQAPALGYRGCTLRCPSGHAWSAYGGVATYLHGDAPPEHRLDLERRFEHALLDTAPPRTIPPGVPPA